VQRCEQELQQAQELAAVFKVQLAEAQQYTASVEQVCIWKSQTPFCTRVPQYVAIARLKPVELKPVHSATLSWCSVAQAMRV